MRFKRARLALVAVALPLVVPGTAHADPRLNTCTVTAGGTVTSFSATCTAASGVPNADSGPYTFNFTWPVSPCAATGTIAGTVNGTGPWGAFGQGAALAVINPAGGLNDLNFGFQHGSGTNTGRHSAYFQFSCAFGVGTMQPNGQVSEIEAVSAVPSPTGSAYCPYGNVNGSASYGNLGAGGGTPPTPLTMTLTLSCLGASGLPTGGGGAGAYTITLSGNEYGGCYSGNGSGTISGIGPSGPVDGAWAYSRNTVHYYGFPPTGTGFIRMGGHLYGFYLWLDFVPPATGACPLLTGKIIGHGLVVA